LKLYQVDAFTDIVFSGNPAAITVFNGAWPSDEVMRKIAFENNLSETAFLLAPPDSQKDSCDFLIRWFGPNAEVSLCGHATLAAALVVEKFLNHEKGKVIRFVSPISGPLPVAPSEAPKGSKASWYTMSFPVDVLTKQDAGAPAALLEALSLSNSSQPYYLGKTDCILVLGSPKEVLDVNANLKKISEALVGRRGLIITAQVPQGSSALAHHDLTNIDFVFRFWGPMSNIEEDPVTGSAFVSLAPLWSGILNVHDRPLIARQVSNRGGFILSKVNGPVVDISGGAALYLDGNIFVPSS